MDDAVTVTPAAADRARELLARAGLPDGGLRVVVQSAGCDGFQALLDLAAAPAPGDVVLDVNGIRLFADVASTLRLPGARLDYHRAGNVAEFRWEHPAAAAGCSCAEADLGVVGQD